MVRIVKEENYTARRNEILDTADQLVYTKGYEQMTIQDILAKAQISKGAFYHYFDSKQALLEALCDRLLDESERVLLPVVQDESLSAIEKLNAYFATAGRWKTAQKAYLINLLHIWYTDDNAIIRQKVFSNAFERITPMLSGIIQQGIREGSMTTPYPERAGEIILSLFQSVGDAFSKMILAYDGNRYSLEQANMTVAVYINALERILGVPTGSLILMDADVMEEWFAPSALESTARSNEENGGLVDAIGIKKGM
jgi:AcrR family transcriptional regulator